MEKRKTFLTVPSHVTKEPVVYNIGQQFDIVTNIRGASVSDQVAIIALQLDGESDEIDRAIAYILSRGVKVEQVAAGDEERARASYLAAADGAGRSSRPMVRTRRYCSKARANLAVLHAKQGRLRSAMEQFQLAITEDPQQMTARLNLAEMLISIGELGESLKLCAQSLQLPSPEDPGIHDDFRRIQRYLLQYRNREREAYDHARGGRLDEAQRILEEEIERFASNPGPYLKLAAFYRQSTPKR